MIAYWFEPFAADAAPLGSTLADASTATPSAAVGTAGDTVYDPAGTTPPRISRQLEQLIADSLFSVEQRAHFHPLAIRGSSAPVER